MRLILRDVETRYIASLQGFQHLTFSLPKFSVYALRLFSLFVNYITSITLKNVSVTDDELVTVADCWEGVGIPFLGSLHDGYLEKDTLYYCLYFQHSIAEAN